MSADWRRFLPRAEPVQPWASTLEDLEQEMRTLQLNGGVYHGDEPTRTPTPEVALILIERIKRLEGR